MGYLVTGILGASFNHVARDESALQHLAVMGQHGRLATTLGTRHTRGSLYAECGYICFGVASAVFGKVRFLVPEMRATCLLSYYLLFVCAFIVLFFLFYFLAIQSEQCGRGGMEDQHRFVRQGPFFVLPFVPVYICRVLFSVREGLVRYPNILFVFIFIIIILLYYIFTY